MFSKIVYREKNSSKMPKMLWYKISRWSNDQFSMGSYSSISMNFRPKKDVPILQQKFGNGLVFAGEHCILDGHQCVHGAWMSGELAAKKIM